MTQTVEYAGPTTDGGTGRGRSAAAILAAVAAGSGLLAALAIGVAGVAEGGEAVLVAIPAGLLLAGAMLGAALAGLLRRAWLAAAVIGPLVLAAGAALPAAVLTDVQPRQGRQPGVAGEDVAAVVVATAALLPGLALTAAAGIGRASRLGPTRLGGWFRLAVAGVALLAGVVAAALTQWWPTPLAFGAAEWAATVRRNPAAEADFVRGPLAARETGRALAAELGVPEAGVALGDALAWAVENAPAHGGDWRTEPAEVWRAEVFTPALRLRAARASGEPLPEDPAEEDDLGGFGGFAGYTPPTEYSWPLFDGLPERAMGPWLEAPSTWDEFRREDGVIALPLGEPDDPTIFIRPSSEVTIEGVTKFGADGDAYATFGGYPGDFREFGGFGEFGGPEAAAADETDEEINAAYAVQLTPEAWRVNVDRSAFGEEDDRATQREVRLGDGRTPPAAVAERVLAADAAVRAAGGPGLTAGQANHVFTTLQYDAGLSVIEAMPDDFGTVRVAYSDGRVWWYAGQTFNGDQSQRSAVEVEAARVAAFYAANGPLLPAPTWPFGVMAGLGLAGATLCRWPKAWLVSAMLLPAAAWWAGMTATDALEWPAAVVAAGVLALVASCATVPGWRAAVAGQE